MYVNQDFSAMDVNEVRTLAFDMTPALGVGETISSVTFVMGLVSGTDPAPANRLNGNPSISGNVVSQSITMVGATYGNVYTLQALVTTTLNQTLSAWAKVNVQSPG